MRSFSFPTSWMLLAASIALVVSTSCAAPLASKTGVYDVSHEAIELPKRTIDITYVKPVTPRASPVLVVFATGDAGWMGASGAVFEHMAEKGYDLAGFDSRKAVKPNRQTGERETISDAAEFLELAFAHAKHAMGLPDATPVIVTGMSRGASMVVFAAAEPSVRKGVSGAVAMALTREADYLHAPEPSKRPPALQVDDKGRIQFYPIVVALSSISMPIAVLQSKGDSYVPSAESRKLMGPDTPMRRLYEIQARNHGFSGGQEELFRALDDALTWIEGTAKAGGR